MTLELERREQKDNTAIIGGRVALTPPIDETYWSYRVRLSDKQAVLGFPKFNTIGIGFAVEEEDWNSNLPYRTCGAETIFNHIKHNKGDESIPDELVLEAIQMIREAAAEDRGEQLDDSSSEMLRKVREKLES